MTLERHFFQSAVSYFFQLFAYMCHVTFMLCSFEVVYQMDLPIFAKIPASICQFLAGVP